MTPFVRDHSFLGIRVPLSILVTVVLLVVDISYAFEF